MSCACKNAEKVQKMLNANEKKHEKRNFWEKISIFSESFFSKIIYLIISIVLVPIVIVIILINFIFMDKLEFILPKSLTNYLKNKENE